MKKLNCLRCQNEMRYIKREKLQLGKTGWILGDLPKQWRSMYIPARVAVRLNFFWLKILMKGHLKSSVRIVERHTILIIPNARFAGMTMINKQKAPGGAFCLLENCFNHLITGQWRISPRGKMRYFCGVNKHLLRWCGRVVLCNVD